MSREPSGQIVFISRVRKLKNGLGYAFKIVHAGPSGSLALTYPDKATAEAAQQQLLRSDNTYYVGSYKLYEAISAALEANVQSGTE